MYPLWPRKPQSVGFTLFGWITTKPTEATAAGTFEQYASDQVRGEGGCKGRVQGGEEDQGKRVGVWCRK